MTTRIVTRPIIHPVYSSVLNSPLADNIGPSIQDTIAYYAAKSPWIANGKTVLDQRTGLGTARPEQLDRCLLLNGMTQYVDGAISNLTFPFTLGCWFKSSSTSTQVLVSVSEGNAKYFTIGISSSNVYIIRRNESAPAIVGPPTSTTLWNRLDVTFKSVTELDIFLNGVLTEKTGETSISIPLTSAFHLSSLRPSPSQFFNGYLFDPQILDRAITQAEHDATYLQLAEPHHIVPGQPTDQLLRLTLDDNSTTLSLNAGSLGASADGTIIDGSELMLATNAPFSRQDLVGYSDGAGGTFIPLKSADLTTDVLDNAAQYAGQAPRDRTLINGPCGTFDGADDYVSFKNTGGIISANMSFGGWFELTASNFHGLVSKGLNVQWSLFQENSDLVVRIISNEADIRFNIASYSGLRHVFATVSGTTAKLFIDGVEVTSGTCNTMPAATSDLVQIGRFGTIYAYDGKAFDVKVYNGRTLTSDEVLWHATGGLSGTDPTLTSLVIDAPFSEKHGTNIVNVADPTGSMDGTANGITEASFWGQTQPDYHRHIVSGCDVVAKFDGASYVDFGDQSAFDFDATEDFSISIRFKTSDTAGSILHKATETIIAGWQVELSGGAFRVLFMSGSSFVFTGTTGTINDGAWHSLVIAVNKATDTCRLYVDGSLVNTTVDSIIGSDHTNSVALEVGRDRSASSYFAGEVLDFSIYAETLTESNALYLSTDGVSGTAPGTANLSSKHDFAGNYLDTSGNNNHGTNNGSTFVEVPANNDGTSHVGRATPSHPAVVGLNSFNSKLDLSSQTAAMRNKTVPSAYTKADGSSGDMTVVVEDPKDHKFKVV